MFAGAAFTDSADVSQTEAVDMLTALGVIDGYEDGSFRPDATVTRAEMAKMIYVIRNGGSDVISQYEGYKTPFADVENVNHWAKGYIAYCYANGIISGKSATSFDPDATVTGTEAAKMALVLIGYDPAKAGLEGSAWATNTVNLATQKNLFQNYGISITGGCDRQYAAQLLYNTLWAGTVRWSNDSNGYEDVVDYNQDQNGVVVGLAYVTVAKRYMGLEEVIATYWGDSKANPAALSDGQSAITYFDRGAQQFATITYVPENGNDWMGESVKVLYKNSKDGTSDRPDKYDTVYGMTLSGETTTVKATLSDIGDDANGKIKVNGTSYSIAANTDVNVNTNAFRGTVDTAAEFTDAYAIDSDVITIPADQGLKQDSADTLKLVLDNGTVIGAYINHVNFYKVTGLTSNKVTLAGLSTLDIDDSVVVADDVAVNDIVAVTTLYAADAADDDAYTTIEKAEVLEGVTVTDIKTGGQEVQINGTWMKYAAINDEVTNADINYKNAVELNATYDFVVYGNTWVAAKKVAASSKDIALVTGADKNGLEERVKVMTSDGTETVYTYDDNDGDGAGFNYIASNAGVLTGNRLFSFSLVSGNKIQLTNGDEDNDGGKAVAGLTFVTTAAQAGDASAKFYNEDTKSVSVVAGNFVAAEDAVAYVLYDGDTYVYKIDDMKTLLNSDITTIANTEYVLNDDDQIVALYVETNKKPGATATNDQYGYITALPTTSSVDGTKCVKLTVWNGTETETVTVDISAPKAGWVKGAFIQYAVGSNGLADDSDVKVLDTFAAVKEYNYNRKIVTLYNQNGLFDSATTTYTLDDDVQIIGVNTKDVEAVEGMTAVPQAFVDNKGTVETGDDTVTKNILYVFNDDNSKIVAIFIDSNNKIV